MLDQFKTTKQNLYLSTVALIFLAIGIVVIAVEYPQTLLWMLWLIIWSIIFALGLSTEKSSIQHHALLKKKYSEFAQTQHEVEIKKLHHLLQSIPVPIVITVTTTCECLFVNKMAENLFQGDIDKYTNVIDLYDNADDRDLLVTRLTHEGQVDGVELPMRRINGDLFWAKVSAVFIDYQGHQAVLATISDITQKRVTEHQLKKSEQILREVFERVPTPMAITLQKDGLVKRLNEAAIEFFGVRDVVNEPLRATDYYVHIEDRTRLFAQLQKRGYVDDFELEMHNHKGDIFTLIMSAVKLELDSEPALLTSFTNITERKQMESELKQAIHKAQEAVQAKNEFLAVMSHEIRTPLNGALSMAHLLGESELSPQQQEYVDAINTSGDALLTLLNDILDLSRLDAGVVELESIYFNIYELIDDLFNSMSLKAKERGNQLKKHIDAKIPLLLKGDPARLRQILFNLLGNALKFTQEGEVEIRIHNNAQMGSNYLLRFEVVDNGTGIPEPMKDNIFEAFRQADSSINRKFGGSGLGLAICKRMVSMMGGQIGVNSRYGSGSTFWFEIELEAGAKEDLQRVPEKEILTIRQLNILLVEDDRINQKAISSLLENAGHRVVIAPDGYHALNILNRKDDLLHESYDLILMDIHMPKMDGLETTRSIRKLDRYMQNIPVIALTADVTQENINSCLKAGIDRVVSKPINMDKLNQAIQDLIAD